MSKANLSFAQGGGGQVVHKNKYTIVSYDSSDRNTNAINAVKNIST